MDSPPASLKSQRSQRNSSFNFLLRGQKVKNTLPIFGCFVVTVRSRGMGAVEADNRRANRKRYEQSYF